MGTPVTLQQHFLDVGDCVVINVNDEVRKIKKEFKVKRVILFKHMKYFDQFLKGDSSGEQLDISVHCDVKIFEWLLKYVDYNENLQQFGPNLNMYKLHFIIQNSMTETNSISHQNSHIGTVNQKSPELEVKTAISILISADFLQIH